MPQGVPWRGRCGRTSRRAWRLPSLARVIILSTYLRMTLALI
jgi:hypothetical protein